MWCDNKETLGLILFSVKLVAIIIWVTMGSFMSSGYARAEWSISTDDSPLELQGKGPSDYVTYRK